MAAWLGCVAAPAWAQETAGVQGAQAATTPVPNWPYSSVKELLPAEVPNLCDDFYANINYDWLSQTELPEGKSLWMAFSECGVVVRERLLEILRNPDTSNDDERKAGLLFAQAVDQQARDAAGLGTLYAEDFQAILAASTLDDITALLSTNERIARGSGLLGLFVSPDAADSSTNACYIKSSRLTLDDAAAYADPTESDANKIAAYEDYVATLLVHFGVSEEEARQIAADCMACEAALAANTYGLAITQRSDYRTVVSYNPRTREELAAAAGAFPLVAMLDVRGYTADGTFVVKDPGWLDGLSALYTDENAGLLRAYIVACLLCGLARVSDSVCVAAYDAYTNRVSGSSGSVSWEEQSYDRLVDLVGDLVCRIYATHYFPQSAKRDVEAIVAELLQSLERRLEAVDWLGEETRTTAIEKLRAMGVHVGYPDTYWPWEEVEPTGASFIDNEAIVSQATACFEAARFGQPADEGLWIDGVYAHTVNAFLNPAANAIMFPAGILQAPSYDPAASRAANLGGIGATIGHEITHTLDTLGSQYDKDGNLANWWTDEDRAAFDERTGKVAAYFSSIEALDGLFVNGEFTIGENVADLGGMAAALDVLAQEDEPDYDTFFRARAQSRCCRITRDEARRRLTTDSHAPAHLRVNVIAQQFQQFYDTYGIVEGDGMYLAPEQRLSVW